MTTSGNRTLNWQLFSLIILKIFLPSFLIIFFPLKIMTFLLLFSFFFNSFLLYSFDSQVSDNGFICFPSSDLFTSFINYGNSPDVISLKIDVLHFLSRKHI